jgi:hypothetical protein
MLKSVLATLVLVASVTSFAKGGDRAAKDAEIKKACAAEIATSGCGDKELGKGLLKCLHAYKKEHKDMVISDSCKNERKELKEARQAKKSEAKPSETK